MKRSRLTKANHEAIAPDPQITPQKMIRPRLTACNQKSISEDSSEIEQLRRRRRYSTEVQRQKEAGTRAWYEHGGQMFLKWSKEDYRTHTGQLMHWKEPYLEELCLLFGNPWIPDLFLEKGSQMGFTELCVSLSAFCLVRLRSPVGFGVEQASKLTDLIGPRFQTAYDQIEAVQVMRKQYSNFVGRKDIDTKMRRITVGGVQMTAFYLKVEGSNASGGTGRQAPSGVSSFPADVIIIDEIELCPSNAVDIAKARQNACELPTKVFRGGSTPGGAGGTLDMQLKASKHLFQWRIKCPHCGEEQFIHPFGNLLKGVEIEEDGLKEVRFVDPVGRPYDWFAHDRTTFETRIDTAYAGCAACEHELSFEDMKGGFYACIKTGITLLELEAQTVRDQEPVKGKVSARYPKLASYLFNARERIYDLCFTLNPADSLQQGLGVTVSLGGGRISMERLVRCVGLARPEKFKKLSFTAMGVDQGHAANIVMIQRWYLAVEHDEDYAKQWRFAFKEVVWHGMVSGGFKSLDALIEDWEVDVVGIDNEPEVNKAADYAREHPPTRDHGLGEVFLIDEHNLVGGESYRVVDKNIQGEMIPIYRCDRSFMLDAVRESILSGRQSFPHGTVYDRHDNCNLIHQHNTAERLSTGFWTKPSEPDHLLHANAIGSAAALIHLYEPQGTGFSFGSLPAQKRDIYALDRKK